MDLAGLARAVEVLMSPFDWGNRDGWLDESLRRVREVYGTASTDAPDDAVRELEALLHLPNDTPGWLRAALDSPASERRARPSPAITGATEAMLAVVSLRCALVAGLSAFHQLGSWRSTLGQVFDDVETGMAIFGNRGLCELARNSRLDELLREEPNRGELLRRISRQAAASAQGEREDSVDLELAGGFYRLVASQTPAGTLLPEPAVVIVVDRLTPGLPTTRELRVAFGLRGREPQVALLAAEGLSNAAIADRLRLSAHTVRHYLERVLDRLGLHSRKALALHLMAGGERQQPTSRRPS